MSNVILASIGTDGDVFPYLGLGAALQAHGHTVTLLASEDYQARARAQGFAFHALVSAAENQELFEHPDFWHPIKNAPLMARWGARFLRRQYDLFSTLVTSTTVLVANPGVLAALLAHETFGVPWANLVLQPWMIPSSIAPAMMPKFTWLEHAPRPVWKVFWRGLDWITYVLIGRELNRLRAALGLPPIRRVLQKWLSRQLVIGMFPEWYGPPQADWPAQVQLVGFPRFDGRPNEPLPPMVEEFCRRGPPPVAFTFGTGMAHSSELFRAALNACEILGVRGIFLTKYREQLPNAMPPFAFHCGFAPFGTLLPQCAAVMHHGGIGTVAAALAAGTPQLVQPICFDQIDNGMRVKRLGAGDCLHLPRATGNRIAAALRGVMTEDTRSRCHQIKTRMEGTNAFTAAAELIAKLGRPE